MAERFTANLYDLPTETDTGSAPCEDFYNPKLPLVKDIFILHVFPLDEDPEDTNNR